MKYDILAKMGQRKDKVVHTSLQAMVPKERPTDPELIKPDEEEIEKVSYKYVCVLGEVGYGAGEREKGVTSQGRFEYARSIRESVRERINLFHVNFILWQ